MPGIASAVPIRKPRATINKLFIDLRSLESLEDRNIYTPGGIVKSMKITKSTKRVLLFMSSPWGRWGRVVVGSVMIVSALFTGGIALIMLPFGAMMVFTGTMNLCPMGPMYSQPLKGEKIIANMQTYQLK
jgi:hypothetical protein